MTGSENDHREPTCRHTPKGIVKAGDLGGAHASTYVCDRPRCIADAKGWAEATAGVPADAFRPFVSAGAAQQRLDGMGEQE